jgi:hypothetical protein
LKIELKIELVESNESTTKLKKYYSTKKLISKVNGRN